MAGSWSRLAVIDGLSLTHSADGHQHTLKVCQTKSNWKIQNILTSQMTNDWIEYYIQPMLLSIASSTTFVAMTHIENYVREKMIC